MLIPLYGHTDLRGKLGKRVSTRSLPQSLLLHGPAGVGKQRLALWLAQGLLCSSDIPPCGQCQDCRYVLALTHPDLTWVFPRPRPKANESDAEDIEADLRETAAQRAEQNGLYAAPAGTEGIYVATVRYLVRQAVRTPALARRKVFVVGEVDRMAQQEGAEEAANAFLKLLEEPPADANIIVTTSAVGALLPTIRSRVVAIRVPLVNEAGMRAFLADEAAQAAVSRAGLPASTEERLRLAQGSPGSLLSTGTLQPALDGARRFVEVATGGNRAELLKTAFVQGHAGARGAFSDTLDALTLELHGRMRSLIQEKHDREAVAASRAIDLVEDARRRADGNVSPQLITAQLLTDLSRLLS